MSSSKTLYFVNSASLTFLLLIGLASPSQAIDLDFKRVEILKEVQETIKDVDLANQIVELRIRRESTAKKNIVDDAAERKIEIVRFHRVAAVNSNTPTDTPLQKNNVIRYPRLIETSSEPTNKKIQEHTVQASVAISSLSSSAAGNAFYVGIGSRISVGYSQRVNDSFSLRTEVSGLNKNDTAKVVDGTSYQFSQKDMSLGAYADWFPTTTSFRISSGMNINRMRTTLNGISNSNVNINGSQVNLGSDLFNVEFNFPKFTPYIGLGFGSKNDDGAGFQLYGDLGLMIGKYDAVATTSLVSNQNVKASDLDLEMNKLRKGLYKWAFIPTATLGLTYRFN